MKTLNETGRIQYCIAVADVTLSDHMVVAPPYCWSPVVSRVVRAVAVAGLIAAPALMTVGCAPLVIGGAAAAAGAGASVATERRGVAGFVSDLEIQTEINRLWLANQFYPGNDIDMTVDSGRVLLVGRVADPQRRVDAARFAWQAAGVREVINEIQVGGGESSLMDTARDAWISAQIRARLTVDGGVSSQNYSIDTVGGVVYLMGAAKSQAEVDAVLNHARSVSGVQRVVSYVRLPDSSGGAPSAASHP